MKVVEFQLFVGKYIMVTPMDIPADLSGKYIPLADYQRLQALLKRWNEIAPGISWIIDDSGHRQDLVDKIEELIQDTSEVLK